MCGWNGHTGQRQKSGVNGGQSGAFHREKHEFHNMEHAHRYLTGKGPP